MSTITAIRCQGCDMPLPPAVNDAIGELYYGGDLKTLRGHLRDLVIDPMPGADDRQLFNEALKRWCGASPEEIVAAVRHIEVEEWADGE